jgi:hypothetical protein
MTVSPPKFDLSRLRAHANEALRLVTEHPVETLGVIARQTDAEHRLLCLALRYPDNDDALIGALLRLAR